MDQTRVPTLCESLNPSRLGLMPSSDMDRRSCRCESLIHVCGPDALRRHGSNVTARCESTENPCGPDTLNRALDQTHPAAAANPLKDQLLSCLWA
ncbi:hypothetical protein AVEN_211151-1 [Araneus ventricosus]|uniref:Uncharacterized protein n=1 Tax=Araneus ventricosus TaxID=182803 RepID=A0A4Y2CWF9_ARAVE|nr:hypothetical protein AVEN_211151-1 [Araneus ventricosus]